jgi:hypothetical protein
MTAGGALWRLAGTRTIVIVQVARPGVRPALVLTVVRIIPS